MDYFFGWLAFLQITVIPGYLLIHFFKLKPKTLLEKSLFVFSLSLISNFVIVFLLTVLHLYTFGIIYLLFITELIALLKIVGKKYFIVKISLPKLNSPAKIFIFILALIVFGRFFLLFLQNLSLKSVFLTGDAIDSWNVWAKEWVVNKIPQATYHYPQLLTTNWSLTYVLMQNPQIEYFAKLAMAIFSIGILVIFFDLAKQTKKITFLLGLIITGILYHYYFDSIFLRDGYADIAFAFFSLLPFYCWLLYLKNRQPQYQGLMLIFALGSFLTKQTGIYILLLTLVQIISDTKNPFKKMNKRIIVFTTIVFLAALGWYLLKSGEILTALNIDSIYNAATGQKFINKPFFSRFIYSKNYLLPNLKISIIIVIVLLLSLLSLVQKTSARVFFFIIIPYFILWSFFLNYDTRNLSVILPYLGFTAAKGLDLLLPSTTLYYYNVETSFKIKLRILVMLLTLTILMVSIFVNDNFFINQQNEGRKQIGIAQLNQLIYQYYYKNGFRGKIATSYFRLCGLPEIGKYCLYSEHWRDETINQSNVTYYLLPENVIRKLLPGKKTIFQYQNWVFVY